MLAWRGVSVVVGARRLAETAAVGGAAILGVALPRLWLLAPAYAVVCTALVAAECVGVMLLLLRRPRVGAVPLAGAEIVVLGLWVAGEGVRVLPEPSPWYAMDGVLGVTDRLCAAVHVVGLAALLVALLPRRRQERPGRMLGWVVSAATAVLVLVVVLSSVVGVITSSDLYLPDTGHRRAGPAPAVLYVHGGGLVLGNRLTTGPGASLAGHREALFGPVRRGLNDQGFVVASIDYRLTPGSPWRAPIEDAKCAVRFLRANATRLGIAPGRIGAWGSSAGGQLVSLLGLTQRSAGFDVGQYADRSSRVEAVVDMFGPSDVARLQGSSRFFRTIAWLSLGSSPAVRRSMSPMTYVAGGAPPFLVLHGRQDTASAPPRPRSPTG